MLFYLSAHTTSLWWSFSGFFLYSSSLEAFHVSWIDFWVKCQSMGVFEKEDAIESSRIGRNLVGPLHTSTMAQLQLCKATSSTKQISIVNTQRSNSDQFYCHLSAASCTFDTQSTNRDPAKTNGSIRFSSRELYSKTENVVAITGLPRLASPPHSPLLVLSFLKINSAMNFRGNFCRRSTVMTFRLTAFVDMLCKPKIIDDFFRLNISLAFIQNGNGVDRLE